ncbi:MAG TPA: carboxypeptidase-like regulatory domain-containing protein [Solirubrobacteraceae bacterium]|jgi:hypothetical protein|nr:carboxypeptidase-like regulatory domain-containing protein [Solirubrobacteraceae bacterium]HXB15396.1 carboxypeptidase-like regulatory domain-containing protein [Solirubrobacteraceae bacterium]
MTTRPTHQLGATSSRRFATASLLAGVLLVLSWMLLAPVSANAAVWEDVTCSLNGHAASTEGWSPRFLGTSSRGASASNTCSTPGGALTASDQSQGGAQDTGSGAEWAYTAPKGEPIAGGVIVTGAVYGSYGQAWLSMPEVVAGEGSNLLFSCDFSACSQDSEVAIAKHGADQVYVGAVCAGEAKPECRQTGGLNAEVTVSSAKILLSDNSRPTAAEVTGSIIEKPASGTASLSLLAGDSEGPGVYAVVVKIDGDPVYEGTPDANGGKCVTVGTAPEGSRQFEATQPCPQSVPVSVQVPTSSFGNGQHTLTIEVEDAAGVTAVVYRAPITIDSALPASAPAASTPPPERGPCNGTPCDEAAKLIAAGQPARFTRVLGHSAATLAGRLTTPTGAPIKGAQVKLLQRIVGSAAATQVASTTTGANGSWSLKAPTGASRLLQVVFYSHTLDTVPASSLAFHESVEGAVAIHAPRRARIGRTVVFTGQLSGGYVPAGGEPVQMEIFYSGRWRTIEVLPTDSKGRWSYKYVFTLGVGASYRFRAVTVAPSSDYPFLQAFSRPVRITVVR